LGKFENILGRDGVTSGRDVNELDCYLIPLSRKEFFLN
jgi:hypothetical protein